MSSSGQQQSKTRRRKIEFLDRELGQGQLFSCHNICPRTTTTDQSLIGGSCWNQYLPSPKQNRNCVLVKQFRSISRFIILQRNVVFHDRLQPPTAQCTCFALLRQCLQARLQTWMYAARPHAHNRWVGLWLSKRREYHAANSKKRELKL